MSVNWESIRFLTMDKLVTLTKLTGSCLELIGSTTPEGWPFAVVIVVVKPGNERALEYLEEFSSKMEAVAGFTQREDREGRDDET